MVRSLISIPAGVSGMPIGKFLTYTAAGSLVWNSGLIVAGYALGENYELIDRYMGWVSTVVLVLLGSRNRCGSSWLASQPGNGVSTGRDGRSWDVC